MADPVDAPRRRCIFCGATPVTREHVWPQWMSRWAGPDADLSRDREDETLPVMRIRMDDRSGRAMEDWRGRSPRQSDHVVKAVCRSCNNGWMAALEAEVQPILIRQMTLRDAQLSESEHLALVRWLIKTCAVYEMDDPTSAVLSTQARRAIASGDLSQLDGKWEVHSFWVRGVQTFGLGHGRAMVWETSTGRPLAQSMVQGIWAGHAGYLLRHVVGDFEMLPLRRMGGAQIWPALMSHHSATRRAVWPLRWHRIMHCGAANRVGPTGERT